MSGVRQATYGVECKARTSDPMPHMQKSACLGGLWVSCGGGAESLTAFSCSSPEAFIGGSHAA